MAVAEVVFEVVTPVFEDIVVFVLDLPAGSAGSDKERDVGFGDLKVADEGVVVNNLSLGSLPLGNGHLAPVDLERVVSFGQWHSIGEAVCVGFPMALVIFERLLEHVQAGFGLEQVDPFVKGGCDSGLQTKMKWKPLSSARRHMGWWA